MTMLPQNIDPHYRPELSTVYHGQRERMEALEQLVRDYRQLVRESDVRNAIVIVHADATLDQLERRATELVGE